MANVMVVGSGAREHTLAWKLGSTPDVDRLFVAPGNGGTGQIACNLPISADDLRGLLQAAQEHHIDLTVVGPEAPLAAGIVDLFRRHGLAIFGPTQAASRLEWSKAFARALMKDCGVPGPDFKVFDDYSKARSFLEHHQGPVVVKANGLAGGKGAIVCSDRQQALEALAQCMSSRDFGAAGDVVVIEECLTGCEISVFAFCDGESVSSLIAACDYKQAWDGDQGPNTGGMGSYSPTPLWTPALEREVLHQIVLPVVQAMAQRGTPYQGVLYAGLMLTQQGPRVLEFNCRLGDPEAQAVLPLLEGDFLDVLMACAQGNQHPLSLQWSPGACVGVVMVAEGYPGPYQKGMPIEGLGGPASPCHLIFHAGTRLVCNGGAPVCLTDGGRVLTVVGQAPSLSAAREAAYQGVQAISFQGARYRHDIALLQ